MDGNKDAARHCFNIGNSALQCGNKAKALKFLAKAHRLDPSLGLGTLLSSLREGVEDLSGQDSQAQNEINQSVSGTARACGDSTPNAVASAEQVEIVHRIRKTKDYYEILGLKKDCTAEELRKAYKKISLKVHPDKNSAAGAEEAFKHVSKAFAYLNDESSRAMYDQHGPEDPHKLSRQSNARYRYARSGYAYDDMFDADEIFNSFFFGSENAFHRAQYVRRHNRASATRQAQASRNTDSSPGLLTLLQILPVLALFLISLIPLSKPVYSMEQVAPYQFQYSTKEHQVQFYVKSMDFDKEYPPGSSSRRSVEAKVERDMIEMLGYNCRREMNHRRWYPSLQTPNCDKLQGFYVQ
ncbi:hypothetical protein GOP47_0018340 [Adiantum capillus-veneris]|uniref:J domain-containing protein n=1 Tax=Adiantum capillus-veneris TaxID=13818 RepID=A0A9D4UHK4_ADICA|nr:hypothetical protein GOP47_0018340 [Adiantum capillus-veneris]